MFVLETGDALRGVAAAASVIDFTVHGLAGTTLTQLADGQLGNTEADIYAASGSTGVITSITLVNTDSVTRAVDLFLKPSGGTSRRLIPKSLSLKANYSLYFDGNSVKVYDGSGNLLTATTALAHASEHTDGTDDVADLVGDSGSGGTHGLTPAPGAGDAAADKYLKADGVWTTPSPFDEILLTPKVSSTGAEGTMFYDSDDDHVYVATE